jgi:hypothetical protein
MTPVLGLALALAMQHSKQVGLCVVLRRPAEYRHRLLSIPAQILEYSPHGNALVDNDCPRMQLGLGYPLPGADSSGSVKGMAWLDECPDPLPHTIAGRFIGRLTYSADGRIEMRLLSARDLHFVHPCSVPTKLPPMVTPIQLP